jgi:hypothetical protein
MTFRVYSGPQGSPDISPLEKEKTLFKEFGSLDEALLWSRHLARTGRVALLLEGDDGTRMTRTQIGDALGVAHREHVGG